MRRDHLWDVDVRGDDDCWEWLAPVNNHGYGYFWDKAGKRVVLAHRRAWEEVNGPIPAGMIVRHSCDNPPCCNPRHLSVGTHRDNAMDVKDRGRDGAWYASKPRMQGVNHPMAKLNAVQVQAIRTLRSEGYTLKQLAGLYGVSFQQISKICNGVSHVAHGPRSVVGRSKVDA